jgi:hypothetical protein
MPDHIPGRCGPAMPIETATRNTGDSRWQRTLDLNVCYAGYKAALGQQRKSVKFLVMSEAGGKAEVDFGRLDVSL